MCGGIGFKVKNISRSELAKYFKAERMEDIKKTGYARSFYWQKDAVLPVETKTGVQLVKWGNKNKDLKLPQTGWAKEESLAIGKWDYLHPVLVDIPADSGYEKKVWFDMESGTKGIIVKKDDEERVYMITRAASDEYLEKTGHDREPLGIKTNFRRED